MAKLKLYSDIVGKVDAMFLQWVGMDAVCFEQVDDFIKGIPADDDKIEIEINCRGGVTSEALAIYDALRASGKEITALVTGECSSSATLVLLSAPREKRMARPNASVLIHNPYICHAEGDAKEVQKVADMLAQVTEQFLDIYVERTGSDRETLRAIMDENKPINIDKAIELGFINTKIEPITAMNKNVKNAFLALGRSLGVIKALSLETADGVTLELVKEAGEPMVGDEVTSPDGDYLMPDGVTIVVTDGVITAIKEPAPDDPENPEDVNVETEPAKAESEEENPEETPVEEDETEELKKENDDLKKQVEELQKQLEEAKANAKSENDLAILNAVALAGGVEWLAKATSKDAPKADNNFTDLKPEKPAKMGYREYYNKKHNKNV